MRGLKDRIRARFNVSVAELADHDLWQSALLGVAAIGPEKKYLNQVLDKVADLIRKERRAEIVDSQLEML